MVMTEATYPHDPAYGEGALIRASTEDLLPMGALVRILRRHCTTTALLPDEMVERLLDAVVCCGSLKPDFQMTIEQRRALTPEQRREHLSRMLEELDQAMSVAYWRHGNPDETT